MKFQGLAIVKMVGWKYPHYSIDKVKVTQNKAVIDITNKGTETMIFKPEEMIGVIDLRLLGYYKIKQEYYNRT